MAVISANYDGYGGITGGSPGYGDTTTTLQCATNAGNADYSILNIIFPTSIQPADTITTAIVTLTYTAAPTGSQPLSVVAAIQPAVFLNYNSDWSGLEGEYNNAVSGGSSNSPTTLSGSASAGGTVTFDVAAHIQNISDAAGDEIVEVNFMLKAYDDPNGFGAEHFFAAIENVTYTEPTLTLVLNGGGPSTYNETMSGGAKCAGVPLVSKITSVTATAGAQCAGVALISKLYPTFVGSAGAKCAGVARNSATDSAIKSLTPGATPDWTTTPDPGQQGVSGDAGYNDKAIGRWLTVQRQIYGSTLYVGVLAAHKSGEANGNMGIERVRFIANDGTPTDVMSPRQHPVTGEWCWWVQLQTAASDGPVEVRAVVIPHAGYCRLLQGQYRLDVGYYLAPHQTSHDSIIFWSNASSTFTKTPVYVDSVSGNDTTGDGTNSTPWATLTKAMTTGEDDNGGLTIYCKAGTYQLGTDQSSFRRWTTITPAPGVSRASVIINGSDDAGDYMYTRLLNLRDLTLQQDSGNPTAIVGPSDTASPLVWYEGCNIVGPEYFSGASVNYPIHTASSTNRARWYGFTSGPVYSEMAMGIDVVNCTFDLFTGCKVVRNFTVTDCLFVFPAHPDLWQGFGATGNNIIMDGQVRDSQLQNWFFDANDPANNVGVIYANVVAEHVTGTDMAAQGITGSHFLLWHNQIIGQPVDLNGNSSAGVGINHATTISIRASIFETMNYIQNSATETQTDIDNYSEVVFTDNHIIAGSWLPGSGTTTGSVTYVDANGNYFYPTNVGTTSRTIPWDWQWNPRAATTLRGAYAASSEYVSTFNDSMSGGALVSPTGNAISFTETPTGGAVAGSSATAVVTYNPNGGSGTSNSLIGDAVFAGLAGAPQTAYQDTVGTGDCTFTGSPSFAYDSILKRDVFTTAAGSYATSANNNAPAKGLTALTFAIWMKVSGSFRSFAAPISIRDGNSVSGLSYYTESDGRTSLWLRIGNADAPVGGQYGNGSSISQPASDWKLWIGTWSSGDYIKLYAADPDGTVTQASQTASTYTGTNGSDVVAGTATISIHRDVLTPSTSEFYGSSADIVIFNRVLNSTEMGWLADTNYRITGYVSFTTSGATLGGSAGGGTYNETGSGGAVAGGSGLTTFRYDNQTTGGLVAGSTAIAYVLRDVIASGGVVAGSSAVQTHVYTRAIDTFTDTTGTVITSHSPTKGTWVANGDSVGDPLQIINNRLTALDSDTTMYYIADQGEWTTAVFRKVTQVGYMWLMLRSSTSAYTSYIVFHDQPSGAWYINRVISGSGTVLANWTGDSWSDGTNRVVDVQIVTNGAQVEIRVYIDGVLRISYDDTDGARITTTGKVGIGFAASVNTSSTGYHLGSLYSGSSAQASPDLDLGSYNETGSGGAVCGGSTSIAEYVILLGNSQLTGPNGTVQNTLPAQIVGGITSNIVSYNFSVGGITLDDLLAKVTTDIAPIYSAVPHRIVVFLLDATNSYYLDDSTGQQAYDLTCDIADAVHALGSNMRLVVTTTPHRDWPGQLPTYPPDDPDINDRIDAGNALILANEDGKFDGVVDVAGILYAISSDPNNWTTDGVHFDQDAADQIDNPIFDNIQRRLDGIDDEEGHGGAACGGVTTPLATYNITTTGGCVGGGLGLISKVGPTITATGGAIGGNSATPLVTYTHTSTSGSVAGGSGLVAVIYQTFVGTGGAKASGSATLQSAGEIFIDGGVAGSGVATSRATYNIATLGGSTSGGAANVAVTVATIAMSGGAQLDAGTLSTTAQATDLIIWWPFYDADDLTLSNPINSINGEANGMTLAQWAYDAARGHSVPTLDDTNDYIISSTNAGPYFTASDDSVTISIWFYPTASGVLVTELGVKQVPSGSWHATNMEVLADGEVRVRFWSGGYVSLGTATFGAWNHAVMRYSEATSNIDGCLNGVFSSVSNYERLNPLENGDGLFYALGPADTTHVGDGTYYGGKLDDFRVYNVALTNTQISALYAPATRFELYTAYFNDPVNASTPPSVKYDITATSGAVAAGSAINSTGGGQFNPSGGISGGGIAVQTLVSANTITGGSVGGSSAVNTLTINSITTTGGARAGSQAINMGTFGYSALGGAIVAGQPLIQGGNEFVPQGGAKLAGSAFVDGSINFMVSGGAVAAPTMEFLFRKPVIVAFGGASVGSAALFDFTYNSSTAQGAKLGSTADPAVIYNLGVQSAGTSLAGKFGQYSIQPPISGGVGIAGVSRQTQQFLVPTGDGVAKVAPKALTSINKAFAVDSAGAFGGGIGQVSQSAYHISASGSVSTTSQANVTGLGFFSAQSDTTPLITGGSSRSVYGFVAEASGSLTPSGNNSIPTNINFNANSSGRVRMRGEARCGLGGYFAASTNAILVDFVGESVCKVQPYEICRDRCHVDYPKPKLKCPKPVYFKAQRKKGGTSAREDSIALLPKATVCIQRGYLPQSGRLATSASLRGCTQRSLPQYQSCDDRSSYG